MDPTKDKPLPNDTCARTMANEQKFIRTYGLISINCINQSADNCDNKNTIICSRTTGEHYYWPKDQPLTAFKLATYFSETGHTLGLDYTRTYVRNYALDIDCGCRNGATEHLNEKIIADILLRTKGTLRDCLSIKEDALNFSVWRLDCGFHIYSNVRVSLPTHLYLTNIIRASLCAEQQQGAIAVLEIPSIMPLPYSAKKSHRPYKPMLPTQADTPNLATTLATTDTFYELFRLSSIETENLVVATVESRRPGAPTFLIRNTHPQQLVQPNSFAHVCGINIRPDYNYMIDQLTKYILNNANSHKDGNDDADDDRQKLNKLFNAIAADNADEEELPLEPNLNIVSSVKVRKQIIDFMECFNQTFSKQVITNPQLFIRLSLLEHGALHLQHYIVMMHKVFINMMPFEGFVNEVLPAIYGEYLTNNNACLKRFIRYYDIHTFDSYTDSWEFMMHHLMFLHQHSINPCDSLNEQIDHYMCLKMGVESANKFVELYLAAQKSEQSKLMQTVIGHYVDALVYLRAIMFNSSTTNYYILDNGNHYRVTSKIEGLPTIISDWIGSQRRVLEEFHSRVSMNSSRFTYTQTDLLSDCKFQFSTSVGVFNSLTGMYSSKSRFLRFLCHRDFAIWELNTPFQMFPQQNERIIERLNVADKMVDLLHNHMTDIFVHFILAPAFLQLKRILSIDEFRITKFNQMIHRHENLSAANFLVEYFIIDPKFIFLIMHIYNKYDGSNTLSTYAKLSDHVFDYNRVDENAWRKKFGPLMDEMKFSQESTHLETLKSINGNSVINPSPEFCLYATLLAVCFIKCKAFAPMTRAFGIDDRMLNKPVKHEHPEYHDFTYETNIDSYRANVERAIRIIFKNKLNTQDRNLVNAMIILGMSTYFDPENTTELLASISALFVPYNVLKKIFPYYGLGGVGKTLICNIIQIMASPKVGRYSNLSQAMDRANVTAKTNVTILNEMHVVDAETIKTVTGNDAISTKQFYTQEYEMHNNQSLIYGATNSVISFRGKDDADRVTINRFHAIRLCGRQINVQKRCGSFFIMFTDKQIYRGTITFKERDLANAVAWLAYSSYVQRRDTNHFPQINEDNEDSAQYREDLYRSNNRLYDFLCDLGIREMQGFTISADLLLNLVRQNINIRRNLINSSGGVSSSSSGNNKRLCRYENLQDFKNQFRIQYGMKLESGRYISDMQQIDLIEHIINNMSTVPAKDSVIRDSDIDERIRMYSNADDRDNASSYFQRENQHVYDYAERVYRDVAFAHDFSKYMGNEIENDIMLPLNGIPTTQDMHQHNTVVQFIRSDML
nr:DNA helicase [Apis mellifera nudivirus]